MHTYVHTPTTIVEISADSPKVTEIGIGESTEPRKQGGFKNIKGLLFRVLQLILFKQIAAYHFTPPVG